MRTWLLLALCFLPGIVLGHSLGASYLSIDADASGRHLSDSWEVRVAELNDVLSLDSDGDGAVTWGELEHESSRTFDYVLPRLEISVNHERCLFSPKRELLNQRSDGYYLVLQFAGRCPAGEGSFIIRSGLFFDRDTTHRVLLKFGLGSATSSTLLTQVEPRAEISRSAGRPLQAFLKFVHEGVRHIWIGYDHIAFLILLLLPAVLIPRQAGSEEAWQPAQRWSSVAGAVLRIVTAFTVAHSITLSLAALGILVPPERPIEAGIAASVIVAGVINLVPRLARRGTLLAFAFGLLHGFGFANVLRELDLSSASLAWPLAGFNFGVEIGQLTIVLLTLPIIYAARQSPLYPRRIVPVTSIAVAVLAGAWLMQRLS
ncbi:MAG TPA: HupE/UreJ family protein [Steroidobacteraceae bacterium]|nr:HupE/UreJ family protein [Steroidobacteraceae bacterium]